MRSPPHSAAAKAEWAHDKPGSGERPVRTHPALSQLMRALAMATPASVFRTCLARGIGRCERSRAMSQAEQGNNQSEERSDQTDPQDGSGGAGGSARGFAAM